MYDITIHKKNECFLQLRGDYGIIQEMAEFFSFYVPGYKFMAPYKNKLWDGRIRLLRTQDCTIYHGLYNYITEFCESRDYNYKSDDVLNDRYEFKVDDALGFINSLKMPFPMRDYQIESFISSIENKRQLILSPTGCHLRGDRVLLSTGEWKNIENITVGDYVIGNDGLHKKVLSVFRGIDDMYKVYPKNNRDFIIVNKEHILPLKFSDYSDIKGYGKGDKDYIENIKVKDYINKSNYYKHCSNIFYNSNIINFKDQKYPDCKLSPYFIGAYLGDGSVGSCTITNIDEEIISMVYSEAEKFKCNIRKHKISYNIVGREGRRNIIFKEFDKIGIHFGGKDRIKCSDKFIPSCLLTTPHTYRLELLAGIIDTDGGLENNTNYVISSKSENLINDIQSLCISLGLVTSVSSKYNKKNNRHYFYIRIMGNIDIIPIRVERKKKKYKETVKDLYRSSFNIEYIGKDDYFGIEVEDNLYITNGGMITHNSGKSAIIYMIVRYLQQFCNRGLLIVPTISLVSQMFSDFKDYGYKSDQNCHLIYGGENKNAKKFLYISTWQSIYNLRHDYFSQFDFVIGDEAHQFKSKSLTSILEKCTNASYRIGTTGTLDGTLTNKLVLEGLFGPVKKATTTSELINNKQLADFKIKCMVLKYPEETCKRLRDSKYSEEMSFLVDNAQRNGFIRNLALSLDNNTLILFQLVEKHGKILYEMIKSKAGRRKVFFVYGGTDVEARERVREITETQTDAIIIASYGTFSTGVNIKNLHNVIFASPSKSRIRNLQSIGRVLRVSTGKDIATLYDISDDLRVGKYTNHTLKHFVERVKIYSEEKFNFKIYNIDLKG